jgi:amino acid permease
MEWLSRVEGMRRTSIPGTILLSILIGVLSGTSVASAGENNYYISVTTIYIVTIPIVGGAILLISALPPLLGRRYWREKWVFHIANVLTISSVIAFTSALLVLYSFDQRVNTTITLAATGVLALLIATGIFVRYLLLPLPWATIAGGALAITIVSLASIVLDMPGATLFRIEDILLQTLPLWLIVWIGILLMETAKFHVAAEDDHEDPDLPRITPKRRMLRLGELLIMNMAVAVGLGLVWLS